MSIAHRINVLIKEEKNLTTFAKKIGLSQPGLASMLKRDSGIKSSTIVSILKLYDNPKLNPLWLLLGEGKMWLDPGEEESMGMVDLDKQDEEEVYKRMNKLLEQRVAELEREIKRKDPDLAGELGIE